MRRRPAARSGAAAALTLLLLAAAGPSPTPADARARLDEPAPGFTLTDVTGRRHRLETHRGRTVILEWTDPGCPIVQRLYRSGTMIRTFETVRRVDPSVVWLAIDSTPASTAEGDRRWIRHHAIPYPVLLDADGAVGRLYDARRAPHLFVIDATGTLRYHGAIDDNRVGTKPEAEVTNYVVKAVRRITRGQRPSPEQVKPYGCVIKRTAVGGDPGGPNRDGGGDRE